MAHPEFRPWWYFVGAGTIALQTALATVSFQSVKAATEILS
ncbi:MAG TPA: hypothetical protein VIN08_19670 [Ohtaekwangia sp.]